MKLALVSEACPPQVNGVARTIDRLLEFCSAVAPKRFIQTPTLAKS
ncbi:MAG: hypothetical protein RQ723_09745 [Desulfuromonadales bacterium]|nr:hypothetical protein [Desulfuromonadales bacterium]